MGSDTVRLWEDDSKRLSPDGVSQLPAADTTQCSCKDAGEPPAAKE
jgi:hypothetical protein